MSDAIHQKIEALREEIERRHREEEQRYRDNLDALERLRGTLLGDTAGPLHAPVTELPAAEPPNEKSGSFASKVFAAIGERAKTVSELAEELGVEAKKVRFALYSKQGKARIKKLSTPSGTAFILKSTAPKSASGQKHGESSAASEVLALLKANPSGMTGRELTSALQGRLDAKNPANAISSALYNMRKSGKVVQDDDKRYSIARHPEESPRLKAHAG